MSRLIRVFSHYRQRVYGFLICVGCAAFFGFVSTLFVVMPTKFAGVHRAFLLRQVVAQIMHNERSPAQRTHSVVRLRSALHAGQHLCHRKVI